MRKVCLLLILLLLAGCRGEETAVETPVSLVPLIGPPAEPVSAVALAPVADGLRKPVYLTHAGDERLFVVEQDGRVRIIHNGRLLPDPFLDISEMVSTDGSERGLLGLAFHPNYAQNGYFYIVYTNKEGDTEISRYTVSANDPDSADPDSAGLLFLIDQPYGNHNGGQLLFGADGYLYIGLGDGGAVSDPYDNAQNPGTLLGSILRVDVDSAEPYAIPDDNPFAAQALAQPAPDARGEVWLIGLRNPWAFSFDRQTGDLYITDVAQDGLEEINFQPAGAPAGVNFGWPFREGTVCYKAETCRSSGLQPPIFEYAHGADGCAVIGGAVYRGRQFPELAGNYFFSDFCSGIIWTLRYDGSAGRWVRTAVYETDTQIANIGEDVNGEMYVVGYRTGEIWAIATAPPALAPPPEETSAAALASATDSAPTPTPQLTSTPPPAPTPTTAPRARWVYAVAAPFATFQGDISLADLQAAWQVGALVMNAETHDVLIAEWGTPPVANTVVPADEVVETVWQRQTGPDTPALAIVPFHQLEPRLKVLRLDGRAPIDMDFDPAVYPLTLPVAAAQAGLVANWDDGRITHIVMTGPAGMRRAVADRMDRYGLQYPGEETGPVLQAADIAHMSNENAFAPDCPPADPFDSDNVCNRDEYFELMTWMGINVAEMTGNHLNDWGVGALRHTFDLYEANGIGWFGGGRDLEDAAQPLLMAHHGNNIAFVGCNPVGPEYGWATESRPGALPCGDYTAIEAQIRRLADEGYLVIATLQYLEDYQYAVLAEQRRVFQALAAAGATAVSGSHAHHPQGFSFYEGAFIHYGLGNLLADQMWSLGSRQTFLDVYTVFDGRLLHVDLWTGLNEDYARIRQMTPAERQDLLQAVFEASDW